MVNLSNRHGLSFVKSNGLINDRMSDFETLSKMSSWVNRNNISFQNAYTLISLPVSVASLPANVVTCFEDKLAVERAEANFMNQIQKHKSQK